MMSEPEGGYFDDPNPFDWDCKEAVVEERKRIINWIKENRSAIELEAGIYVYRDHFDSQLLLAFLRAGTE